MLSKRQLPRFGAAQNRITIIIRRMRGREYEVQRIASGFCDAESTQSGRIYDLERASSELGLTLDQEEGTMIGRRAVFARPPYIYSANLKQAFSS